MPPLAKPNKMYLFDANGVIINPSSSDNQTNGLQKIQIVDPANVARSVEMDSVGRYLLMIDPAHHHIHEGEMFVYKDVISLNSAGTQDYIMTTPNSNTISHFAYEIDGQGQVTIEIFEATDKTPTTLQTSYSRNRNSLISPVMTIHKNQSGGTTDGTRIIWRKTGSDSASAKVLTVVGSGHEIMLKKNTKYLFRITSGLNSNIISLSFDWYEHDSSE